MRKIGIILFQVFLITSVFAQYHDLHEQEGVPDSVKRWIHHKLNTKSEQRSANSNFFTRDSVWIVGYIKGYTADAGFTRGIIYHWNNLTREQIPILITIKDDGRFEASYIANHPHSNYFHFNEERFIYYVKPGEVLALIMNIDDLLHAKQNRLIFLGKSDVINKEISDFDLVLLDYQQVKVANDSLSSADFLDMQFSRWDDERQRITDKFNNLNLLSESKLLIWNKMNLDYAKHIIGSNAILSFDFIENSSIESSKSLKENYSKLIKRIDLNDSTLMSQSDFFLFINSFEYSSLFKAISIADENILSSYKRFYKGNNIPFIYQVAIIRKLAGIFLSSLSDSSLNVRVKNLIDDKDSLFFPIEMKYLKEKRLTKKAGYELPNNSAANSFRNIINKHKGKYLVIDFWAQWCGPCRMGIENTVLERQALKDHPNLDFIFITDEEGTPDKSFFESYNEKNFMIHSYRVTAEEYLAFSELFKFAGIPRYILVNDEGRIMDDDFDRYLLDSELASRFPDIFKDIKTYTNKKGGH